jgi:predicted branched-subunit amino acid permease
VSSSASEAGSREGLRAAVAISATVWFFGASFGLVARAAGLGVVPPLVMSATTFAGSAQFAVSSILGADGSAAAAIVAAVLLNALRTDLDLGCWAFPRPPPPPAG